MGIKSEQEWNYNQRVQKQVREYCDQQNMDSNIDGCSVNILKQLLHDVSAVSDIHKVVPYLDRYQISYMLSLAKTAGTVDYDNSHKANFRVWYLTYSGWKKITNAI